MRQCLCKAVCGNVVGDIIRGGLGGIAGVAHGDADPGIFQHRHVVAAVAKGDGLLPRQAQMGQRVGQAVGLAAARGQDIAKSGLHRTARQPGQRRRNSASFSGGRNALSW